MISLRNLREPEIDEYDIEVITYTSKVLWCLNRRWTREYVNVTLQHWDLEGAEVTFYKLLTNKYDNRNGWASLQFSASDRTVTGRRRVATPANIFPSASIRLSGDLGVTGSSLLGATLMMWN